MNQPNIRGGDHGEKEWGLELGRLEKEAQSWSSWIRALFKASLPIGTFLGPTLWELKNNHQNLSDKVSTENNEVRESWFSSKAELLEKRKVKRT